MQVPFARRVHRSVGQTLRRASHPLLAVLTLLVSGLTAAVVAAPSLATPMPYAGHHAAAPHASPTDTLTAKPKGKPSIADVQKQLGQLAVRNSQIVEQYDAARVRVTRLQRSANEAARAASAARARYNRANSNFTQVVQAQYESGGVSMGGALLSSTSGSSLIDRLSTMNLLSNHDAAVVTLVRSTHREAVRKSNAAKSLLASATSNRDALAKRKSHVGSQITKYRTLLSTLNSQQRADYLRAQNPSVHTGKNFSKNIQVHATSAAARRAIQFALAQVGKPYVWGASGPSSYDCSGLTMRSWEHGGVHLPHSAAGQYGYGHHVSRNDLQPGDLIFFYQPIGHVTIYIGNGLMVSAPETGEDVSVVPLNSFNSDYTGATRLT